MAAISENIWFAARPKFWLLVAFLVLVFLMGGSGRADVQSLSILRPISIVVLGVAIWMLEAEQLRDNRILVIGALAVFAVAGFYLIPLPSEFVSSLPGRGFLQEIDETAGIQQDWRALSMARMLTTNSVFALTVPLAMLAIGVQLTRNERYLLLPVLLALGLLGGAWGLLQAIGDPGGPLYFYRITNEGSAVGLFANRNHQAALLACLFPMLAVYAYAGVRSEDQMKMRAGLAIAAGVILVPLLLVTGSRAGLVFGMLGIVFALLMYRKPVFLVAKKRNVRQFNLLYLVSPFSVLTLGALSVIMSRGQAVKRLMSPDETEELRWQIWSPITDIGATYFPLGTGPGTFALVYQHAEREWLLRPTYVNQVHNDWIDIFLTLGLPGVIILSLIASVVSWHGLRLFWNKMDKSRAMSLGRLGFIIVALVGIFSIFDYPVRTPALSAVAAIGLLWLLAHRTELHEKAGGP